MTLKIPFVVVVVVMFHFVHTIPMLIFLLFFKNNLLDFEDMIFPWRSNLLNTHDFMQNEFLFFFWGGGGGTHCSRSYF